MPNSQVLCPYYVKDQHAHESNVVLTDVVLSFKFELSESILKQLIKHLFHTFWLVLFRFKSKYGCPISSKITKLYFILNIIYSYPEVKTLSQIMSHYWTIPLNFPCKMTLRWCLKGNVNAIILHFLVSVCHLMTWSDLKGLTPINMSPYRNTC